MNKALIFILAFLLAYSACTEKIEETVEKQPEYPVLIETVDGIKTIKNPDFPRDGQIQYKFAEELSIGGEGESWSC
jgi:ABC-type bacteriocin/lantibiotic exporter with double-glycine peptidase domain